MEGWIRPTAPPPNPNNSSYESNPSTLSYPTSLYPPVPSEDGTPYPSVYPPHHPVPVQPNPYNPVHPPYPTDGCPFPPVPPVHPPHPQTDETNQVAFRWVDVSAAYGMVPSTALQGGVDIDGHQIYVGRAYHEGDWIPAKVIPGKNVAYVAYDGGEHMMDRFQVLCEQRFDWIPNQGGTLPQGAVQGGRTSDGEPLYIGRAFHEGSQTVGKVHLSHGACYIPFDGKEIAYHDYEILILRA